MKKCAVISEFSIFGIIAERLESSQAMRGPVGFTLRLSRYKRFVHGDHISMPTRMRQ